MNKLFFTTIVAGVIFYGSLELFSMDDSKVVIAFQSMYDDAKDLVYDRLDSKSKIAYRITSKKNFWHQSKRNSEKNGGFFLRQSFLTQNPLIAINNSGFEEIIFPQNTEGRPRWYVLDPRSEAFYEKDFMKAFKQNHRDEYLSSMKVKEIPGDKYGNKGTYLSTKSGTFDFITANPLLLAIVNNSNSEVCEELKTGNYNSWLRQEAKSLAIHTDNIPAFGYILEHEKNAFMKDKGRNGAYAVRSRVCAFNHDLLYSAAKEDDREFKVLVRNGDYDVMTRRIPFCAVLDSKETPLSNLKELQKSGKCTPQHVEFYENELRKKNYKKGDCIIL